MLFPYERQHDPRGTWVTMQAHKRPLLLVSTLLFMALCQSEEDFPRASAKQLRLWKKFYVATGGESWRHCSDAYHDPCSCSSGRRFVRCDSGGWITHIHLFNNGMRGTLPPTLGNFKRLIELFVYENELVGAIPESIGQLQRLRKLSLSSNSFGGELPEELGECAKLSMLWLHNNQFRGEVPAEWSQLGELDHLNLMANRGLNAHARAAAREAFGDGVIYI